MVAHRHPRHRRHRFRPGRRPNACLHTMRCCRARRRCAGEWQGTAASCFSWPISCRSGRRRSPPGCRPELRCWPHSPPAENQNGP
jgi:hypothetical protein